MAKRLIESSESQALRDALGEAREALGSEHDVLRLREKLGALPPVSARGEGSAAASSTGAKVAVIGAASVLILGAAVMIASREPAAPAPSEPAPPIVRAPEPPVAAAPAPAPEVAPPVQAAAEQQPSTPAPRKVAPRTKAPAIEKAEPAPAPAPTAPKELELLTAAQDAMDAAPQRALGLLEQHAQLYPNGSFAIERESLAIDALRKLGRVTAAQERARAFVARFPKAPNVKHLQRWLDEGTAIDHKEATQPLPTP